MKTQQLQVSNIKEEMMNLNSQLRESEQNTAKTNQQLESLQKKLDNKTKELLESNRKQTQLAMAKSQAQINEVIPQDDVQALLKQYEHSEQVSRQEKESLQHTLAAN